MEKHDGRTADTERGSCQIRNADELGSGTRNLFKYTMLYSDRKPEMFEDDIFKITVPLDENYSTDFGTPLPSEKSDVPPAPPVPDTSDLSENQRAILELIKADTAITQQEVADKTGLSRRAVQNNIGALQKSGLLKREGSKRDGRWVVTG
ncbi:MAG: winged helix-turn-helix transcriptional regulator [Treponema sp.]|nr:winged helix-turn-helix transcriptional regulator [Treponema sp.]